MIKKNLQLSMNDRHLQIAIDRLIVAGWVGKDRSALQKHIDELAALGIQPPGQTPTYMNLDPALLTTTPLIDVVAGTSSGEVECVVIMDREGHSYLGVGSDHTDRDFERHGIPASKQMCAKPMAAQIWAFADVQDHLDQLILRSWMTMDGQRKLYQEGKLADNRGVVDILEGIPKGCFQPHESFALFCGTFPALGGLVYGQRFEFELFDPVLDRRITHGYDVQVLPQFL